MTPDHCWPHWFWCGQFNPYEPGPLLTLNMNDLIRILDCLRIKLSTFKTNEVNNGPDQEYVTRTKLSMMWVPNAPNEHSNLCNFGPNELLYIRLKYGPMNDRQTMEGYNLCTWDMMDKVISFADRSNRVRIVRWRLYVLSVIDILMDFC